MIENQKFLKVVVHLVHDDDVVSGQILGVLELSNLLVAPLIVSIPNLVVRTTLCDLLVVD